MKAHRLAEYFPILEGEEFEQLKQDIKENGQLEPIVTYQGEILDGVNRYRACRELGKLPNMKEYLGDDPLSYVISANIRRRHLTESQRAVLATEMLPELEKEGRRRMSMGGKGASVDAPFRATEEAAREFGVSMPSVVRAKRIKEQAPERIPDIMVGKTSVRTVDQELREQRAAEKRAAKVGKEEEKKRQETPREVKVYMDALKEFKQALVTAIKVAEYGKFSPEAIRFTIRKHDEIRELFDEFKEFENG